MIRMCLALFLGCFLPLAAQTATPTDPWKSLAFLEGTWKADTAGNAGVKTSGKYTFARELGSHILARHSTSDPNCKAPATFDCAHSDLLYIFEDSPGASLKAIYFDNEGHVLHYDVSTPSPTTAVFLSEATPGPQFRLLYELKSGIMTGKFQMRPPGQADWHSYLEWSGPKD